MSPSLPSPFPPYENLEQGLTKESLDIYKKRAYDIVTARDLTPDQQLDYLAGLAVGSLAYPEISNQSREYIKKGVLCLLSEGAAPYHPRYVAPDYARFLRDGSAFLELTPASDLLDATTKLLIAYEYTSVSSHPVFVGRIDELLEPFVLGETDETVRSILRSFWLMVDRLCPSAFVHANIGPQASRVGEILLSIERELKTLTNVSLRYDPNLTPVSFALMAVQNALLLTKPYFLNHPLMLADWGDDYCIASCYNGMRIGGGIHTMVRLNLKKAALLSDGSKQDFLQHILPEVIEKQIEIINSRSKFLVEEAGWFKHSFTVAEGLLNLEKFTAYAGIFGLADAVNHIMVVNHKPGRYGYDPEAYAFAQAIMDQVDNLLKSYPGLYCSGTDGHVCLHAQVGISEDQQVTPAARIPTGEEPELYDHILTEAPTHKHLIGGCSTILEFDQTAATNPLAVLDIIKGAHASGTRNLSIGSANSEFVRVTGYLARRCDLDARLEEKTVRHGSDIMAAGVRSNQPNLLRRRVKKV